MFRGDRDNIQIFDCFHILGIRHSGYTNQYPAPFIKRDQLGNQTFRFPDTGLFIRSFRGLLIETVRGVRFVLRDIKPPLGMYWKSRIVWSEPMGVAKAGFDCTNIRLEVIAELD